jgi:serine/threonine protein kinase
LNQADFGIAVTQEELRNQSPQVCGTLPYMAPEQLAGRPGQTDARSDIYSLGVILHELVTGVRPDDPTVNLRKPPAEQETQAGAPSNLTPLRVWNESGESVWP